MAINENVYKSLYEYSYYDNHLFTTTDTLPNLLNEGWQKNSVMDDSNVFTTFNPNKYQTLCGSSASEFVVSYNKDQETGLNNGATNISIVNAGSESINLRYFFTETFSTDGSSIGFRWTGYDDENYLDFINAINYTNQKVYDDYNYKMTSNGYKVTDSIIGFNDSVNNGLSKRNMQFITDITRDNLFYQISIEFSHINDEYALIVDDVPLDTIIDWLKNDTSGFLNYNGNVCFVTKVNREIFVRRSEYGFELTSNITRKNLVTGESVVIDRSSIGSLSSGINILCEKYHNNLFYYSQPLINMTDKGFRTIYNNGDNTRNNASFPASNGSTSTFTYIEYDSFTNSIDDTEEFNSGFSLVPLNDFAIVPLEDVFFSENTAYQAYKTKYKLYDRMLLSELTLDPSFWNASIAFERLCLSGNEIMANLSLSLIPFIIDSGLRKIDENSNPNAMFIGVRDEDGTVSGNYIPYIYNVTKPEEDFRPDDFVPVNPIPDIPESDPDRNQIKPPNREGDNINLHLDNRFGAFNGFLTLYNLTQSELSNFGSALMGNPLNYRGNFQKDLSEELSGTYDVSSILNYIVSVKIYPFSVSTLADTSIQGTGNVFIGTGEFGIPIGSSCRTLTSSISVVNAGSLYVAPLTPYMDFRDYYNTTVVCYMPYCGCVELNPMDIMNTTLQCYYLIDFLTGECTSVLYSIGSNNLNYPVAIANGNIGIDIPLSATNSGQLSAIKKMQNAQTAHTVISYINSGLNMVNDATNFENMTSMSTGDKINVVGNLIGGVGRIVDNYFSNSANPYGSNRTARSAVATPLMPSGSGATNFMLNDSVYLQIRRGTYSRPNNYASTMAYPNTFSSRLYNVKGLTYCSNVNVTGINCTQEEKNLIKSALEGGTIL